MQISHTCCLICFPYICLANLWKEVFHAIYSLEAKGKCFTSSCICWPCLFAFFPLFIKHKNDYHYRSLGASGAVSAVVFAGILFDPTAKLGFFFIPPIIPGYIFGPLYLILSTCLEKRSQDNVNHSAHIWGALFGIVFHHCSSGDLENRLPAIGTIHAESEAAV